MASEKDLALLDEYIANRLTEKERVAFEQKLAEDSDLRQEYAMQQKIADGIRQARVAELKTMLNNVSVASVQASQTSSLLKIAGIAVVTALTVAGLYVYNSGNEAEKVVPGQTTVDTPPEKTVAPKDNTVVVPDPSREPDANTETSAPAAEQSSPPASEDASATRQSEPSKEPVLDVFEPSEEVSENKGVEQPAAELKNAEKSTGEPSIVVETDSNNKKYSFHYQFREEKLFLYGPFEKDLYEILEFFTDNKRTIFLFYNSNYYLLNDENEKVKPLNPINDPALLKKLKEYRN